MGARTEEDSVTTATTSRPSAAHAFGSRRGGTFTVLATKSIAAPADRLYDAFADPNVRGRWLPYVAMQPTTLLPARSARFEWRGGTEQVDVSFTATRGTAVQVAVEHSRLPSEPAAAEAKAYWRARLADLKSFLES
jgi:hypothetical protein